MHKITIDDIESIVDFSISDSLKQVITTNEISYVYLSSTERDNVILQIINQLNETLEKTGPHRHGQWERSWKSNVDLFKNDNNFDSLIPNYFNKSNVGRWKGEFVNGLGKHFDYKLLNIFVDCYLHKYVGTSYENLFEFGCGSAHNLVRFGNFNKNINLIGLDWATSSQEIIKEIQSLNLNTKIKGYNFDLYSPSYKLDIPVNSAIFTCDSLEQLGENYKLFVDFLLNKKPSICINFEPITELLDENKLLDKLSILYSKKRNYLTGYLTYLEKLEKENKIKILVKKRLPYGSLYLEPCAIIIWKVL